VNVKEKVGHLIVEEKGGIVLGQFVSLILVVLLLLVDDAIFFLSLGCVWYFLHCLESLELDKLVMNEPAFFFGCFFQFFGNL
jgi:hypothetical protein